MSVCTISGSPAGPVRPWQAFQLLFNKVLPGDEFCDGVNCEYEARADRGSRAGAGFFVTLENAIWWVFLMTLGEIPDFLQFLKSGEAPGRVSTLTALDHAMGYFLFTLCMICGFLIMLNLMIAIMATSYEKVMEDGVEDDWRMEQASVIISMETNMSKQQKTFVRANIVYLFMDAH